MIEKQFMKIPDDLQIYFGSDYIINDYITIHQPTLGEIIDFGELNYWQLIGTLTATPTDMMSVLWDIGMDWEEVSEFDLFSTLLIRGITKEESKILLGDLDLQQYFLRNKPLSQDEIELYNPSDNSVIDANIYRLMTDYMRKMAGLKKNVKKAGNKLTKEIMIDVDRQDRRKKSKEEYKSHLMPLISSMINSPGFKYNLEEVRKMPYCTFIDCVQRVALIKNADTLSLGRVCGMADLSKVPKKEFDWLREIK